MLNASARACSVNRSLNLNARLNATSRFTEPGPRSALRPRVPYVPRALGWNACGLSHCTHGAMLQVRLDGYGLERICTGRSCPRPVSELSLPTVVPRGWPLPAWNSGASCQLLSRRLFSALPRCTPLVAASDVLKLCRVSKMHGPQSAWRLNGCEFAGVARAAPNSVSERQ